MCYPQRILNEEHGRSMNPPTLKDLGLDDGDDTPVPNRTAKCMTCGATVAIGTRECASCGEIRRTSSTTVRRSAYPASVEVDQKSRKPIWILLGVAAALGFPLIMLSNRDESIDRPDAESPRVNWDQPTYRDLMQVLVDGLDDQLKANVFGYVTVKGKHLFVVVEADFFVRLTPDAKRLALESIRDQWFSKCYGENATFKTWNGEVVAQF